MGGASLSGSTGLADQKHAADDRRHAERAHEGHRAHRQAKGAEIILVGRDLNFSYAGLVALFEAAHAGAHIVVTKGDISHPGAGRVPVPETGALAQPLIAAFPELPVRVIGKPERPIFERALALSAVEAGRAVMLGDNPLTDGAGARASEGLRDVHPEEPEVRQPLEDLARDRRVPVDVPRPREDGARREVAGRLLHHALRLVEFPVHRLPLGVNEART